MTCKFYALIQGSIGPGVWDKHLEIDAADISDALGQAQARAEETGGQVVELAQSDWGDPICDSLTAAKRTLRRLNERVHSGYDFNADPDGMTLEVGNALR